MSDDSPFPPNDAPAEAPRQCNPNSLCNLLPPCKPGEVRNKYGRNGRDKNKIIVDFMEEIDPRDKKERTRIRAFLETIYLRALAGHSVAIKYIGEQYAGKAKQRVESVSVEDIKGNTETTELLCDIYRKRLFDGEMSETELAEFARFALGVSKDQRESAAFMAKQQIDPEVMRGLIQDYLRAMPREEFVQMVAQVRSETKQEGARV